MSLHSKFSKEIILPSFSSRSVTYLPTHNEGPSASQGCVHRRVCVRAAAAILGNVLVSAL